MEKKASLFATAGAQALNCFCSTWERSRLRRILWTGSILTEITVPRIADGRQANNNLQTVSPTGVETVKKAGTIFNAIDPEIMLAKSKELSFTLVDQEANQLPNGKSFLTFDLMYHES